MVNLPASIVDCHNDIVRLEVCKFVDSLRKLSWQSIIRQTYPILFHYASETLQESPHSSN